jgi:hypothetical protein
MLGNISSDFYKAIFSQNRLRLRSVSSATDHHRRFFMVSTQKISGISQCTLTVAAVITPLLCAGEAFASQGPGGGLGTASNFTQLAMAIIVYGTSALVVGSGLIGAARKH